MVKKDAVREEELLGRLAGVLFFFRFCFLLKYASSVSFNVWVVVYILLKQLLHSCSFSCLPLEKAFRNRQSHARPLASRRLCLQRHRCWRHGLLLWSTERPALRGGVVARGHAAAGGKRSGDLVERGKREVFFRRAKRLHKENTKEA